MGKVTGGQVGEGGGGGGAGRGTRIYNYMYVGFGESGCRTTKERECVYMFYEGSVLTNQNGRKLGVIN